MDRRWSLQKAFHFYEVRGLIQTDERIPSHTVVIRHRVTCMKDSPAFSAGRSLPSKPFPASRVADRGSIITPRSRKLIKFVILQTNISPYKSSIVFKSGKKVSFQNFEKSSSLMSISHKTTILTGILRILLFLS